MFGINGGELIILLVVVALVVGPERLPTYAQQLGAWARRLRGYVQDARKRVDDELGDVGLDWEALDPRRYAPRRIVREALLDDAPAPSKTVPPAPLVGSAAVAGTVAAAHEEASSHAPYDDEAT